MNLDEIIENENVPLKRVEELARHKDHERMMQTDFNYAIKHLGADNITEALHQLVEDLAEYDWTMSVDDLKANYV